VIGADYVMNA